MRRDDRFTTIRTVGGLLPSDLLARVAEADRTLEGIDPGNYHLAAGERLSTAIGDSWNRLVGAWARFTTALADLPETDRAATALTRSQWSLLLFQELGYGQLQTTRAVTIDGKDYPVSHQWGRVPIHLVGARVDLDRRTAGVAGAARSSPHGLVQELLNRSDEHLWGIASNGLRLRLLRDNVSLTRQAYVEFDLEAMLTGAAYADFVVLWLCCHQSRLEGDIPEKFLLERWAADAAQRGTRALDQLRGAVESAIATLGQGFLAHPANRALTDQLRSGALDRGEYYRQLLRLVYRLLFLAVAEARDVLNDPAATPTAAERYRRFYSLDRLQALAETRRGGPHGDLWAALQLVFRSLGDDAGCPALAIPALGSFLWSAEATPDIDDAQLRNRDLLDALRALSSTRDGKVTRTVDYRNLGAEELGSVYESLLELHPELNVDARTFSLSTAAGHERKTTGSYYTPTSLIKELLDSALDPVLAEAATHPDPEAAILRLRVLDPAVGSGHFLIAAAQRIAKRLASIRTGDEEPSPDALRSALRDVVGRCLHGIDLNPMAVELCKVSLCMEAVEPGKPLSFLDHHIVLGNSLLGATPRLLVDGVPDEAFKPLTGDDKEIVKALRKRNASERKSGQQVLALGAGVADLVRPVAEAIAAIDALPDATPHAMREKERRHASLIASHEAARARLAADAWCAAFVLPKVKDGPVVTDAIVRQISSHPERADSAVVDAVRQAAADYGFLHLHLAFPHIFTVPAAGTTEHPGLGWDGGFDVVLGNPPWERVKLSEKEFFAGRHPEVADAAGAKRKRLIAALADEDPSLFAAYEGALRQAEGESHLLRSSGRYPLCGRGDVNTFAVFAENMTNAMSHRGRTGIIVPTGIATDDTTKHFFGDLIERQGLVAIIGFYDRKQIFTSADVHSFCLLIASGSEVRTPEPSFIFFARNIQELADSERWFSLTRDDFRLLNPNTRTCPVFRSRRDAEITKAIYRRVPVLVEEGPPERNPWDIRLTTMFHMTNDSALFRTAADCETAGASLNGNIYRAPDGRAWLPMYEGRLGHQFNHRFASQPGGELIETSPRQLADPSFVVTPQYWVAEEDALDRLGRRTSRCRSVLLGFRRVARNTDERTVIAAMIPWGAASYGWILNIGPDASELACLAATYNSFIFDYLMRGALIQPSVPIGTFEQLPVLPPERFTGRSWVDDAWATWHAARVLELTYTAWDLADFATDLGYKSPPFRWDDLRRRLLRAELDACFFHLYGLGRDDVDYVMDTFTVVRRRDETNFGEYRTKRLILECYDAMADAIESGKPYQTILDPPPAHPSLAHPRS